MTTKAKFFKLAADAGIEVDYTPGGKLRGLHNAGHPSLPFHCTCDAPHRKLFAATGLHVECGIQGEEGTTKTDWTEACLMMSDLIAQGFQDCTDPDCEWCNPETDTE